VGFINKWQGDIMSKNFYELQPIRIPGGWKVEFNRFTEYDLMVHDKDDACLQLTEYLLRLSFFHDKSSTAITIDLGWYPDGDTNGNYNLIMVRDYNWVRPLEEFITKSKSDIVYRIEYWSCIGFYQKYIPNFFQAP